MFIVLILVISAAILGGMGGWFLARAKLHKEIQQARYDATNEYFLASQDYDRDYEP
jgi:membrane protein YqaA with SNARE-associated domain